MFVQVFALVVLGLVFLIATWKPVHLGLLALVAAFGVGLFAAGMSINDIFDGFPVNLLILLVGITYLFSIAREAGVIDWVIHRSIGLVRGNVALLPWVFYALSIVVASMGSPLACVAVAPIAMFFVTRYKIDPVIMGLAVIMGGSAGGFAPISLYGVIVNGIAANAGIAPDPILLFVSALGFSVAGFTVAYFMFGGITLIRRVREDLNTAALAKLSTRGPDATKRGVQAVRTMMTPGAVQRAELLMEEKELNTPDADPLAHDVPKRLNAFQIISLLSLAILLVGVIVLSALDIPVDVGVVALGLAVLISLIYPKKSKPAMKGIDWSTVLLVGGIITYAGVLQGVGAIDMLGDAASRIGHPLVSALIICLVGAFVSAFASTTGIIGALIPMSLPLMATGTFEGYGLVVALALSSSLVDATPFSTAGAAAVAGAPEEVRPRLTRVLMRWGLSMIIIGPIATVLVLVFPSLFF